MNIKQSNKNIFMKSIMQCIVLFFIASQTNAQECNENIIETTPTSRFNLSGEFILDNKTNLFWTRCAVGQIWKGGPEPGCTGTATLLNWKDALDQSVRFNTNNPWRLPNIKELSSIVERACNDPAINEEAFPNSENAHWTSTPYAIGSGASAWSVGFNGGGSVGRGKQVLLAVRFVRNF